MSFIAGAILALVVFGFASPSTALAGCGHYSPSKMDRDLAAALANLDHLMADTGTQGTTPAVPARRPCSGPSCSEAPPPQDAPTPPTPPTGERWLCAPTFADLAVLDGQRLHRHEPSPRPVNRPATLERPPRSLPA
jgi:hypothetical protein